MDFQLFWRNIRFSILGMGMLGYAIATFGYAAESSISLIRLTSTQIKSLGIETRQGVTANSARQGGFPGQVVVPHEQMRLLSTPFPALVEQIYGAPGLAVKKGQWLFRLSVPQALELRRDREQAAAANLLAQQSLKRDELLFAEGIIAESRLQATRASAVQAGALFSERQDALKSAGLVELGNGLFELRASLDGVILEQRVQVGQRVDASELLGKIGRMNILWVDFQVPASTATYLKVGQAIEIPAKQLHGKLIAVGRAVDASQSVQLRARIELGREQLAPGQSVEVVLAENGQVSSAAGLSGLRLPSAALVRHQGGHFVFLQAASERTQTVFQPQSVELLGQNGDDVLVKALGKTAIPLDKANVVTRGTSGLKAIWIGVGRE
ncbi:MAG: hypothetical protein RIR18_179 [Pseudomonadota bacterium]|jgi:multidrug efflux pump subunit AcrA (membrane-fusion protein)